MSARMTTEEDTRVDSSNVCTYVLKEEYGSLGVSQCCRMDVRDVEGVQSNATKREAMFDSSVRDDIE